MRPCFRSTVVANSASARRLSVPAALLQRGRVVRAHGQASRGLLSLPMDRDLEEPLPGFDRIADALSDFTAGKFLVVLDDEDRENEGDLIIAADKATTEAMAFMVEYTSGVVCIGMEGKDLDRLRLPLMVQSAENEDTMHTAFTVTVDLRHGISTGISASDRAKTIRKLADPSAKPDELRRPGHIFPLRARHGGVLIRPGHTEASVDLARLAGCFPAGALCEIVNKGDGSMARTPYLMQFAKEHGLRCIAIADLIRYRLRHEQLVTHTSSATLDTRHGQLHVHTFKSNLDGAEHLALVSGNVSGGERVLVQVKQESRIAELLGCGPSASSTVPADIMLQRMASAGQGVLIYMQHKAADSLCLVDEVSRLTGSTTSGASCSDMDLCDYAMAAQILAALNVQSVVVPTDSKAQLLALKSCGVDIKGMYGVEDHQRELLGLNGRGHLQPSH
jgi:3,4-dihydroxy 2-butanone 4-phosphate synthase/GTP cyclohydrolase II